MYPVSIQDTYKGGDHRRINEKCAVAPPKTTHLFVFSRLRENRHLPQFVPSIGSLSLPERKYNYVEKKKY